MPEPAVLVRVDLVVGANRHRDDVAAEVHRGSLVDVLDDADEFLHRATGEDVHPHVHVHVAVVEVGRVLLALRELAEFIRFGLLPEPVNLRVVHVHAADAEVGGVHVTEPLLAHADGDVRAGLVVGLDHVLVVHAVQRLAREDEVRLGLPLARSLERAALQMPANAVRGAQRPALLPDRLVGREDIDGPGTSKRGGAGVSCRSSRPAQRVLSFFGDWKNGQRGE